MICDTCHTEQGVKGRHYEEDDKKKFMCTDCLLAPAEAEKKYLESFNKFYFGGKLTAGEIIKYKLKAKRDSTLL